MRRGDAAMAAALHSGASAEAPAEWSSMTSQAAYHRSTSPLQLLSHGNSGGGGSGDGESGGVDWTVAVKRDGNWCVQAARLRPGAQRALDAHTGHVQRNRLATRKVGRKHCVCHLCTIDRFSGFSRSKRSAWHEWRFRIK